MSSLDALAALDASLRGDETKLALRNLTDAERWDLRQFWLGRANGELTTALSFEYMLDDLRTLAAPVVLCDLAERAIAEEHRHVDWCLYFADLLGEGQASRAELGGTRPLRLDGATEHDNRILRTIFGGCFSETVAVQVLLASQRELRLDSARRLNRQHLSEEVQHARLGWGLLAWSGLNDRDRDMVGAFAPALAELTRQVWLGPQRAADAELHALGYLSTPLVAAALETAFDEVIWPGLEQSGVKV